MARDNGSPARSATAVVTVDIQRNFQAPVWVDANLGGNIPENQAYGVSIIKVSANDPDSQVKFASSMLLKFYSKSFCRLKSNKVIKKL